MLYILITAFFAFASAELTLVGGYSKAPCDEHRVGMGMPVNTLNHALRFMHSLFNEKELKLVYYASQIVAGTNHRAIFEFPNADKKRKQYIAVEVYLKLPHYETAPQISELFVTLSKTAVLNHFKITEQDLLTNATCNKDILTTLAHFDLQKELQTMEDTLNDFNKLPRKKTKGIDPYAASICSLPMMSAGPPFDYSPLVMTLKPPTTSKAEVNSRDSSLKEHIISSFAKIVSFFSSLGGTITNTKSEESKGKEKPASTATNPLVKGASADLPQNNISVSKTQDVHSKKKDTDSSKKAPELEVHTELTVQPLESMDPPHTVLPESFKEGARPHERILQPIPRS